MKINSLKKQKHGYLIQPWLDKTLKGTVVNLGLLSMPAGIGETLDICSFHFPQYYYWCSLYTIPLVPPRVEWLKEE